MKYLAILIPILLIWPLLTLANDTDIPRHIDTDGPAQGVQPLDLQELWRVGGEDEDVIFGRIMDVIRHPDGNLYVLDNQLCQVAVISPDGELISYLSREGDGPGELRQPMGLVFLGDDALGVGLGFPGKLVALQLDGTPITSYYPIGEPAEGNVGVMMSVKNVDGILIASGGRIVFDSPENSYSERFLAVSDENFSDGFQRILQINTPLDPTGRTFVEADDYYIDLRWALGPQGKIFAPMKRDAYEVSVFDTTGQLLQVFGRQEKPRRRTPDNKDEVGPMINAGGDPANREWDIEDNDPSIARVMYNFEDDTVWILSSRGANDQPEGILETWDVFGTDGEYLKRVPIPLGNVMNDGTCYLVGGGRLVVIRGTGTTFYGDGESGEDEEEIEPEPLEVICYEIK